MKNRNRKFYRERLKELRKAVEISQLKEIRRLREENRRLRETYESNGMMIMKEAAE